MPSSQSYKKNADFQDQQEDPENKFIFQRFYQDVSQSSNFNHSQAPTNRKPYNFTRHPAISLSFTLSACAAESPLSSCAMSARRDVKIWSTHFQLGMDVSSLESLASFTPILPLHLVLKLRSVPDEEANVVSFRIWSGRPSQKGGIPSSLRISHDTAGTLTSFTVESWLP